MHECPIIDISYTGPLYYDDESSHGKDDSVNWVERLVTVSQDGVLNMWKINKEDSLSEKAPFEHISSVNINLSDSPFGTPRCISFSSDCTSVIVGTTGNSIALVSSDDFSGSGRFDISNMSLSYIINGHSRKVKKVAAHPEEKLFATISGVLINLTSKTIFRFFKFKT